MLGILLKHHVYINTCASYASTPYPELLKNMTRQECGLAGHSKAESCWVDTTGEMGAIKQMWLNDGGIATITPLKVLKKIWPITYDSGCFGGLFIIHTDQGKLSSKTTGRECHTSISVSWRGCLSCRPPFVQTVRGSMEVYTHWEDKEACTTHKAQAMLGHPTNRDFLGMVHSGMITKQG